MEDLEFYANAGTNYSAGYKALLETFELEAERPEFKSDRFSGYFPGEPGRIVLTPDDARNLYVVALLASHNVISRNNELLSRSFDEDDHAANLVNGLGHALTRIALPYVNATRPAPPQLNEEEMRIYNARRDRCCAVAKEIVELFASMPLDLAGIITTRSNGHVRTAEKIYRMLKLKTQLF